MKYRLNNSNYCTFDIFEVNRMPGRSYFIPYPDRKSADAVTAKEKRYGSEKVVCLNGEWDFKFFPRPAELPEELDTDTFAFDRIDVPACWQFRGYDRPFYTNIRYQFPFKPPYIPTTGRVGTIFTWMGCDQGISPKRTDPGEEYNFVGVYRRTVELPDPGKRVVISFLGVASCLDLFLNGRFVGYAEGAHNTAEFDLTGKVNQGTNELVAVVHRWCNGTYLEDQDMFRNNGIFRDVLLRISDAHDIADIDARTEKTGDTWRLKLTAEVFEAANITFTVEGPGVKRTATVASSGTTASVTFDGLTPLEWNAESPVLYSVYYETPTCCVKERIGFRTVEIRGDVFLVNGRKLKLHGVNHHDTSPVNGYTLTPDEIERDVRLCKEFNIDTVRTSHYPPDPLLLELADETGLYIVDENDLETHGTWSHQLPPTYNTISHNPKWESHYIDRISRLYERDKVHGNTGIIMWSLGNEAGGYHNTDAMYHWLKERSTLPVHYESAIHCKRIAYDVGSEMYPSVQMVHDAGEHCRKQKQLNDRPYFMCEYAHAMGVGPGNTEAYWQQIYQYDNLMGGCVWEMVDHAVLHEDGRYTYGGDHGEYIHDRNFCVDGMFYPDRTPSVGAKIIRFIYRPIRVTWMEGSRFELFNTTAFSAGDRYRLTFTWNSGETAEITPKAGPLERETVTVPVGRGVNGTVMGVVTCVDTVTGRTVSEEQLTLAQTLAEAPKSAAAPEGVSVDAKGLAWQLPDGETLAAAEQGTLLYRAATDNDTDMFFRNTMLPYIQQKEQPVSCEKTENGWRVQTKVSNKKAAFMVTDTYEGTADGLLVTSRIHCVSGGGILPRFGKSFRLNACFNDVTYTGRAGESYCDMKEQFPIREVRCRVTDMTEPNIRPQESGNRCDCTVASVSDGKVRVTFTAVGAPFELAVKPYSDKALAAMKHREDEERTGTYVTVQAFQQGIGTGACGPAIMPEYQYDAKKDYELKFLVRAERIG